MAPVFWDLSQSEKLFEVKLPLPWSKNRDNNVICGGNGKCNKCTALGLKPSCTCDIGWTNGPMDSCECPISNKQCKDKKTNQICFGRGNANNLGVNAYQELTQFETNPISIFHD